MAGIEQSSTEHSEHGEHSGPHARFLAHHFENQAQQFDAGKLGMWLFLVQEILFFSGLFCAYAIYRSNHPEIFAYADHFLDRKLGAINTCVLIFSSFTIAWAIRATQLNQRMLALVLLGITFLCACGFLSIKYVEYHHKWKDNLLWGCNYEPENTALGKVCNAGFRSGDSTAGWVNIKKTFGGGGEEGSSAEHGAEHAAAKAEAQPPASAAAASPGGAAAPGAAVPTGNDQEQDEQEHPKGPVIEGEQGPAPHNVHIFFGIYFAMTGLHAIHVIIGMGVIIWMMLRTARGDFSSEYFGPVEYVGLYWHLVDLVWIYLFPLLYLIH